MKLWIAGCLVAILVVVAFAFGSYSGAERSPRERREDILTITRDLKLDATRRQDALDRRLAAEKVIRDRQDQRTQRLLCSVITEVLHAAPSLGLDSQGDLASDCANRESHPLIPQRSMP